MKEIKTAFDGYVEKELGNGMYDISIPQIGATIGHISGKMRINKISIAIGDKVVIEISNYNTKRGRIIKRLK